MPSDTCILGYIPKRDKNMENLRLSKKESEDIRKNI